MSNLDQYEINMKKYILGLEVNFGHTQYWSKDASDYEIKDFSQNLGAGKLDKSPKTLSDTEDVNHDFVN